MTTNLLIVLAIFVTVAADAGVVVAVRREMRRWCFDAYKTGVDVGKAITLEASGPFAEAYRLGYDVGYERGASEACVSDETPERGSHGWIAFEDGAVVDLPDGGADEGPHDPRD